MRRRSGRPRAPRARIGLRRNQIAPARPPPSPIFQKPHAYRTVVRLGFPDTPYTNTSGTDQNAYERVLGVNSNYVGLAVTNGGWDSTAVASHGKRYGFDGVTSSAQFEIVPTTGPLHTKYRVLVPNISTFAFAPHNARMWNNIKALYDFAKFSDQWKINFNLHVNEQYIELLYAAIDASEAYHAAVDAYNAVIASGGSGTEPTPPTTGIFARGTSAATTIAQARREISSVKVWLLHRVDMDSVVQTDDPGMQIRYIKAGAFKWHRLYFHKKTPFKSLPYVVENQDVRMFTGDSTEVKRMRKIPYLDCDFQNAGLNRQSHSSASIYCQFGAFLFVMEPKRVDAFDFLPAQFMEQHEGVPIFSIHNTCETVIYGFNPTFDRADGEDVAEVATP